MKYPKLQTLWKRDQKGNIMEGEYSRDEFASISRWMVTEKIDGTNVRILFRNGEIITIGARNHEEGSTKFGMHKGLLKYLKEFFTVEKMIEAFPHGSVTLFGEGYGANIQKGGGNYREDQGFILFDVVIHDVVRDWWLERESVVEIATTLDLNCVPQLVTLTSLGRIQEYVKSKFLSLITDKMTMEGIVATSYPQMLFRNGDPIKFKLKCRDYGDNK